MCKLLQVVCKICERWVGEDQVQLCEIGLTGTICLPPDAKLVPVFRYINGIKIVNLSNARILDTRGERFVRLGDIMIVQTQKDGLCFGCSSKGMWPID